MRIDPRPDGPIEQAETAAGRLPGSSPRGFELLLAAPAGTLGLLMFWDVVRHRWFHANCGQYHRSAPLSIACLAPAARRVRVAGRSRNGVASGRARC